MAKNIIVIFLFLVLIFSVWITKEQNAPVYKNENMTFEERIISIQDTLLYVDNSLPTRLRRLYHNLDLERKNGKMSNIFVSIVWALLGFFIWTGKHIVIITIFFTGIIAYLYRNEIKKII